MSQPVPKQGTPEWWLLKLAQDLAARQGLMQTMNAYYTGDHPLPFLTKAHNSKMRDEFRQLLEDQRTNFMRLVVDAVEERMRVEGFRLSAETDPVADKDSWAIWQANQMDAESQAAFIEALVKGVSYLSVWAPQGADKYPSIAVEDPSQTIVAYRSGSNFRVRDAALKIWDDDMTGLRRANVYLTDGIYKFQAKPLYRDDSRSQSPASAAATGDEQLPWVPVTTGDAFVANPLGVVPIIPLRNRPRLLCEGESELSDMYRIQNQINAFQFLLALGGYFGAHKQRWAVGLTIMEDEHGRPKEPFDVDVGKLWVATQGENGQQVQFGEFSQTDLSGYIKAIEQKVTHLAVVSRVPKHYLLPEGQEPSGDAIRSAESGLVKKVERKHRPFGEGLEEAMRLARRFAGEKDSPVDSEIVWADPQTETQATLTDAVIKQYAGGLIPWEAALEKLGYTQTQIQRFSSMRLSDKLLEGIADPAPPAPVAVHGPRVSA